MRSRSAVSRMCHRGHGGAEAAKPVAWLRLVPLAVVLMGPIAAHAGPCSEEITRVATVLNDAQARGEVLPSAPESEFAKLHRQPTPRTVITAENEGQKKIESALARARKLDSEGKESECMAAIREVAVPLGVHRSP